MQASWVEGGQRTQFVVAVDEVADGTLGQGELATEQLAVDLGDALVVAIAERAGEQDDVEAELVVRQGDASLGLRSERLVEARTERLMATADA
jgi:hypothetical protein